MKYFIYCRKSSEAEDRQVASIESQLTTLRKSFGDRPDIEIVRIYEEAFSAKAPGRAQFSEMLNQIEKGAAEGIIAWAPDRLARNSIDGGRIIYMLDCGVISDLKFATYTFENNSQGKFMLQIMFGQSKYYSDALSDNVKRGNRTKVEKGWRPAKAPIGYLNEIVTKTIVPDPDRFPLIRQIFELMLTGLYSPQRICKIARNDWGLRTPKHKRIGGKPIVLSSVYRILTSPFYAGTLVWGGRSYKGAHMPLVTIEEFEQVQRLLHRQEKPRPQTRRFAFTGLVRCGDCGLLVTAEEKTNRFGSRYTYYHCSRRRPDHRCRQPSITVQEMERQIGQFLDTTVLASKKLGEWANRQLGNDHEGRKRTIESQRQSAQHAIEATEREMANLTSLRVRDLISDEEFVSGRKKMEQTQLRLRQQLEMSGHADSTFEPADALISFSSRALDCFMAGDLEAKRLIFDSVGSNPTLKDKMLIVEAKKPFRCISHCGTFPELRAFREDIRILHERRDPELLRILANIKTIEMRMAITPEDKRRQPRRL
jgi:site-specific DNA recombinase